MRLSAASVRLRHEKPLQHVRHLDGIAPIGARATSGPNRSDRTRRRTHRGRARGRLATSTRVVYASAWVQWTAWCRTRDLTPLPASPEAIAAYLVERAEAGLSYGTIDLACSAISHHHHRQGFSDPMGDITLRRVRRGLRRIIGVAPRRQAHPLTVAEVGTIVSAIDPGTATGVRDRALILLGYASALRPSELAALRLGDLTARRDGILIRVRRSKTDQDGVGQLVGVVAGRNSQTDPIGGLAAWLSIRPGGRGPLFTRIHQTGVATLEPIGPRTVSRMVQARAAEAGMDGKFVSGHSLRAGHATTAAANGAGVDRIAAETRHRDLDTLIEHYIRPSDALATSTSRDLGCDRSPAGIRWMPWRCGCKEPPGTGSRSRGSVAGCPRGARRDVSANAVGLRERQGAQSWRGDQAFPATITCPRLGM